MGANFGYGITAEEARARVAQQVQEAQERAAHAARMRRQVEAVRGKATSRRGEATVEVDSGGRLITVELDESALSLTTDRLEKAIMEAFRQAHRQAANQVGQIAVEAFGEDSPVAARVREEAAALIPDEPAADDDSGTAEPAQTNW